jgi:thymidylate kinase
MSQRRGRFIAIEGVDGSGKSTVARLVAERLGESAVFAFYKQIATSNVEVENAMRQLAAMLWPRDQTHLTQLPSRYRVILHAAWASILSECVVAPALATGHNLLLDGWCYKIMARFLVDGYEREYLKTLFSHLVEPDQVIVLDPDVESVWERGHQNGRRFTPVEMGLYQGYAELNKDTFISYQSRSRDALLSFAQERNANVKLISGGSLADTVTQVERTITESIEMCHVG